MSFRITYSPEDLVSAQAQHWGRSVLGWRTARAILVVGILLGAFYAFLAYDTGEDAFGILVAGFGGLIATAVVLIGLSVANRFFILPRTTRKTARQLKEYQGPWDFEIADHKLNIKTPRGNVVLPFTDFVKWSDSGSQILLYRTDKMFNLLPKAQVAAADQSALLAELELAGVPRATFGNS